MAPMSSHPLDPTDPVLLYACCFLCCDSMSMVIEDVVPMDSDDPNVVTAAITSVVEQDLPFTQLGEGDTRVRTVTGPASCRAALRIRNMRSFFWYAALASAASSWCQLRAVSAIHGRTVGQAWGAAWQGRLARLMVLMGLSWCCAGHER